MSVESFNSDSATLIRAIAAASARSQGTYQNNLTGYGTTRDPFSFSHVGIVPELTDVELAVLFSQDHIIQKIAYLYPQEAATHWMNFTVGSQKKYGSYGLADADLQGYLNSRVDREPDLDDTLNTEVLSSLFYEQSLNARVFGRAYLLLGVEDGEDWDMPIAVDRIKSLRWIEPAYHFEISPVKSGGGYTRSRHFRFHRYRPDSQVADEIRSDQLIHRSRILPFYGVSLPEFVLQRRAGQQLSVLQGVYRALSRANQAIDAAMHLLATASIFSYGLKGLSEIKDEAVRATIEARFESIMMAMSVLKGMPHDADQEEIGFVSRQFGGVKELLELTIEQIAQNCDVPRFKLFEQSQQAGLSGGDKSKAERYLWSQLLDTWRSLNWKNHFLYLGKIAALAKDSPTRGRSLKDLGVSIPPSLQLTPQEMLEMRNLHLDAMGKAKSNEILTPYEIRMSTYGASQWSFDITLDEEVSQRMEEAAKAPQQPDGTAPAVNQGVTPAQTPATPDQIPQPETLPQFDRVDDASRAQKKLKWQGFTIGMQYFPFDERHGRLLRCGYGYFEKTRGADGMACDVYIGTDLDSPRLFVVDQYVNGQFDEHKYIIGVRSLEDARALFLSAMPSQFMGAIREGSIVELEAQRVDAVEVLSDDEWDNLSAIDNTVIKKAMRGIKNADT